MIETNIRIVEPGTDLRLKVRVCELSGQDLDAKSAERACDILRSRGVAAVTSRGEVLIWAPRLATPIVLEDDTWRAEVRDSGRDSELAFGRDSALLAQLLERRLLIEVSRLGQWWKLDGSRIWYERVPVKLNDDNMAQRKSVHAPSQPPSDIAAYRRYEISSVVVDGIGVGLVVDIGTAFFTTTSVADFFRTDVPTQVREENLRRFERLSLRQRGQKATLLYDCGKTKHKCYFEKVNNGETCSGTGEIVVRRKVYSSLFAYCQDRQPDLGVKEGDPVARVSFPHIDRPVPVAANRLFLRVMNDVLPKHLDEVDKIPPSDRRWLIQGFWDAMGVSPLGAESPVMRSGFWRPPSDRTSRCDQPTLLFAKDALLAPPSGDDLEANQDFFRKRMQILKERGCFHVPATVPREIHFAVHENVDEAAALDLADAISKHLSKWTKQNISVLAPQTYGDLTAGIESLRAEARSGIVLFVFEDHDPAAYYTVSSELKNWRVKRATVNQLMSVHRSFVQYRDQKGPDGKLPRAVRGWLSFTEMCALDVLQQMNCVPWRPAGGLNYEAHLTIDVGHDRRFYAVSLLICRAKDRLPHFWLDTLVEVKADPQRETINEIHLKSTILRLFKKARRTGFSPLRSVLVVRDGHECGREMEGIAAAKADLIREGFLESDARLDAVDFQKQSQKGVRLWEILDGEARNVLEGTFVMLGNRTAVLANTGRATLHQGTAEPVMLTARTDGVELDKPLADAHTSSHFNWSNPRVAQRLPIGLKRTDEQLENRTAQEIKRIR